MHFSFIKTRTYLKNNSTPYLSFPRTSGESSKISYDWIPAQGRNDRKGIFEIASNIKTLLAFLSGVLISIFIFFQKLAHQALAGAFSETLKNKVEERTRTFNQYAGFQPVNISVVAAVVIRILISILAVMFLGLIVFGGYVWMMARGNEKEVDRGRSIIRHSIIGLIILLSSYAIGYFILYMLSTAGTGEGRPLGQ